MEPLMTEYEIARMEAVLAFNRSGKIEQVEAQFGAFATIEEIAEAVIQAQEEFVAEYLKQK
jgi:hypothetical protein